MIWFDEVVSETDHSYKKKKEKQWTEWERIWSENQFLELSWAFSSRPSSCSANDDDDVDDDRRVNNRRGHDDDDHDVPILKIHKFLNLVWKFSKIYQRKKNTIETWDYL